MRPRGEHNAAARLATRVENRNARHTLRTTASSESTSLLLPRMHQMIEPYSSSNCPHHPAILAGRVSGPLDWQTPMEGVEPQRLPTSMTRTSLRLKPRPRPPFEQDSLSALKVVGCVWNLFSLLGVLLSLT